MVMGRAWSFGIVLGLFAVGPAVGEDRALIASMDELRFRPPEGKGSAELVEGRTGRAVRFRFEGGGGGAFATSNIRGNADWDRASGFSFWVRGEGPDGFGGLQLIFDDDYAVRYDLCFPIPRGDWSRVVVAWDDLIPVLPGPRALPLGVGAGKNAPSKVSGLWFGRWWYWGDYPPIAFGVDEIRLEAAVDRPGALPGPPAEPLARARARLESGRPVTVVTMGDSLTDKRHWSNREVAWVDLIRDRWKARTGSEVTVVDPAIGGTQLRQNLVLMPRWLAGTPSPDLVAIFFGGNEWDAGMRGDEFRRACEDAVDRVRRATGGASDVLLMTTGPSLARWEANDELAGACRAAARGRGAGLADVDAAFRRADAGRAREALFVDDRVHLARPGHELVAGAVERAVGAQGRGLPPVTP